jgi:tRNA1(Val) A37 N6-methylase TrmN6
VREIACVSQGYFPTQQRIVAAISRLITSPASHAATILDLGCGCGAAIATLRQSCNGRSTIKLYGIEFESEWPRKTNSTQSSTRTEP